MTSIYSNTVSVELPPVIPITPIRFDVLDQSAYQYLDDNGYVVFKDVANSEEQKRILDLSWDFFESLSAVINRSDISTWDDPFWPDPFGKGIVAGDGVGQCAALWYARGIPKVQQIFSKIWDTPDLITSFDGLNFHRPFEHNIKWKTEPARWYHWDQNGCNKPGKICIQGFLNILPSGPDDGGLVVIPKSHTIFTEWFEKHQEFRDGGDFVTVTHDKELWELTIPKHGLQCVKICLEPGDFVCWDSRTIHCNAAAEKPREIPQNGFLGPRRLVTYICMTPKARLSPEIHQARIDCYYKGDTTSHWPEDAIVASARKNATSTYVPVPLSEDLKKLIPL